MRTWLIQSILIISLIQRIKTDCLQSSSTGKCCADYYFKDGTCKPCERGYFGPKCEETCPYPSYGYRCVEGQCECPKRQCDFSLGCFNGKNGGLSTSSDSLQLSNEPPTPNITTTAPTTALDVISDGRNIDASDDDNLYNVDRSSLLLIVILSSSSSIIVSVVVALIVACRRNGRFTRRRNTGDKTSTSIHEGRTSSTDSYDDIDDRKMASSSQQDTEEIQNKYESLDEGKLEKYMYSTLLP